MANNSSQNNQYYNPLAPPDLMPMQEGPIDTNVGPDLMPINSQPGALQVSPNPVTANNPLGGQQNAHGGYIKPDDQYLQHMRQIAFGNPGNDKQLQYQLQQDRLRQGQDQSALGNMGASSMATQQGNMAMRGGLTSGASERIGQQNLLGQLTGQQNLSSNAAIREGGYRGLADQRKRDMLTRLGGEERGYADSVNKVEASKQLANAIGAQGGGGAGGLMGALFGGASGGNMNPLGWVNQAFGG